MTLLSLERAAESLTLWASNPQMPESHRLDVDIDAAHLLEAVAALRQMRWGYLAAITGVDLGVESGVLEVLYHFANRANVLTLRVKIPRENAAIDSLCGLIPAAVLYEMELREMLGVNVRGLKAEGYLFLAEDWPSDVHPLRKDADLAKGRGAL